MNAAADVRHFSSVEVPLFGTQLIEASAGTGKTYTITMLLLRMLLERGFEVPQVLVVTYTRAATAELRDRIRRRLQAAVVGLERGGDFGEDSGLAAYFAERQADRRSDLERLRAAVRDFDEASIFTIHGFCQRALVEGAFESGASFEVDFIEDQRPLLADVAADYWAGATYAAPAEVVSYLLDTRPPRYLAELSQLLAGNPNLRVLPERAQTAEPGAPPAPVDPARFRRQRAKAAQAFVAGREEIERILLDASTPLSRVSYRQKSVREQWLPFLSRLEEKALADFDPWFARLTPEGMVLKSGRAHPVHPFFDAAASLWELVQQDQRYLEAQALQLSRGMVDYLGEALPRRKRAAGLQSFDDLLRDLDRALGGPNAAALLARLRGRYRAALIDEFQDTDPLQFRVFAGVFGAADAPLFLIGDPKQAIYGFRGADVFAYLAAARAQAAPPWGLTTNYRSAPGLVAAINHLFAQHKDPFGTERIRYHPVVPAPGAVNALVGDDDACLQWLFVPAEASDDGFAGLPAAAVRARLSAAVAQEVEALLHGPARIHGRPVVAQDVAVLCRTNVQARGVQEALRRAGIPSALEGDSSVFDSPVSEELRRVLTAVTEPSNRRAVRAALATSLFGVTAEALFAFGADGEHGAPASSVDGGVTWDDWVDRFFAWQGIWNSRGFAQAFFAMLEHAAVPQRILAYPDGERRLTNLLHLGELLQVAASTERLRPLALLSWFAEMCANEERRVGVAAESAQIRLESDEYAVRLTTIHKSKGLEYPIVFCPYLWSARSHPSDQAFPRFHDADDVLCVDIDTRVDPEHRTRAQQEAFGEDLRLLYVALTRAKHRCYVVWGNFGGVGNAALAHLAHADQGRGLDRSAFIARIKKLSDAEMLAELEALSASSHGALGVRRFRMQAITASDGASQAAASGAADPAFALREPPLLPIAPRDFRVTSFSGIAATDRHGPMATQARTLSSDGTVAASTRDEVGRDRDADTTSLAAVVEARVPAPPQPALLPGQTRVPLHAFPAGAGPGTLIHDVFEHLDFFEAAHAQVLQAAQTSVRRFGFSDGLAADLADAVHAVLQRPLPVPEGALCLADLKASDRRAEMEFTLRAGTTEALVGPEAIASVLQEHAATGVDRPYAARLRGLGSSAFHGYLRGYIDLVFRHGGRYYLVDYKSNHLGSTFDDYVPSRLLSAMQAHHYLLQYQLYTVALDRHLASRVADYRYERDFGGVFYLFVRGMGPRPDPGAGEYGVFYDRPAPALVSALGRLLCGPGPAPDSGAPP